MLEKDFLSNWKEVNAVTCSLIKAVPNKKWHCKPFQPRFKSLAWEFSCILSTRAGYIRGMKAGKLVKSCFVEDNEKIARLDKNQMLKQVNQTDVIIQKLIEKSKNKKIYYWGNEREVQTAISWLLQHEQLHFGKLILYFAKLGLKIPKNLKVMWGEKYF